MEINILAVGVATVVQFICGAIWYMPLFGNLWGKIHGFDKYSKEEQKKMQREVMPLYGVQIAVTVLTSFVLGLFIAVLPSGWNVWGLAGFFWLGFVLPTQVSAVIFGGTEPRWVLKKILIMSFGSLACLLAAATVFAVMK